MDDWAYTSCKDSSILTALWWLFSVPWRMLGAVGDACARSLLFAIALVPPSFLFTTVQIAERSLALLRMAICQLCYYALVLPVRLVFDAATRIRIDSGAAAAAEQASRELLLTEEHGRDTDAFRRGSRGKAGRKRRGAKFDDEVLQVAASEVAALAPQHPRGTPRASSPAAAPPAAATVAAAPPATSPAKRSAECRTGQGAAAAVKGRGGSRTSATPNAQRPKAQVASSSQKRAPQRALPEVAAPAATLATNLLTTACTIRAPSVQPVESCPPAQRLPSAASAQRPPRPPRASGGSAEDAHTSPHRQPAAADAVDGELPLPAGLPPPRTGARAAAAPRDAATSQLTDLREVEARWRRELGLSESASPCLGLRGGGEGPLLLHGRGRSGSARERLRQEMMAKLEAASIPPAFICPITQDLMLQPVVTADGQTYERDAIEEWLRNHQTSPLTGERLAHVGLTPNVMARGLITEWLEQQGCVVASD